MQSSFSLVMSLIPSPSSQNHDKNACIYCCGLNSAIPKGRLNFQIVLWNLCHTLTSNPWATSTGTIPLVAPSPPRTAPEPKPAADCAERIPGEKGTSLQLITSHDTWIGIHLLKVTLWAYDVRNVRMGIFRARTREVFILSALTPG